MADRTPIEWTDATWNPITGCSVVSAGCKHCYAMKLAGTRMRSHPSRVGLTKPTKAGPVWTGEVRLNEQWLDQPLRWSRPRTIFVCAHGDLFHENVPERWIDEVFAVMAAAPWNRFQVLTKRPERMLAYAQSAMACGEHWLAHCERSHAPMWPLANVWLGVSIEDQDAADLRVPPLLQTPAAIRFLSVEPMLGPLNIRRFVGGIIRDALGGYEPELLIPSPRINWVIVGGESGLGARPMRPDWVRSIRDQCDVAGVPFLFKQWGEWLPEGQLDVARFLWAPGNDGRVHWWQPEPPVGSDLLDGHCSIRVSKRQAGRFLDGVAHDGMPA